MSPLLAPFHTTPWVLASALLLDLLLGDPRWLPHPIRWIGWAIASGERLVRRLPLPPGLQGGLLVAGVVAATGVATWAVVAAAGLAGPWVQGGAKAVVLFYGLSLRSLGDEVLAVARALERQGLPAARHRLSFIVGRETHSMGQAQVSMAAVETAAENLVDGFAAPLLYGVAAGPVGIMAYKAVNTLDSMVGYRNERYLRFGAPAARLDDLANWLPARLTLLFLALLAPFRGQGSPWSFGARVLVEAGKHASPNSGIPEAAFALLLGVRLGGPATYGGRPCPRPFMAPENPLPGPEAIPRAVALLYLSGLALAGLLIPLSRWWVGW